MLNSFLLVVAPDPNCLESVLTNELQTLYV